VTESCLPKRGKSSLNHIVESKMEDIRLAFTHDFKHPRPFSTYRPRLVASCLTLYSGLVLRANLLDRGQAALDELRDLWPTGATHSLKPRNLSRRLP
jgi:hypothetical protein